MTSREKIELFKDVIYKLYVNEGRSKSYISKLLEIDRKTLTKVLNNEYKWIQGKVKYIKPSDKKFLNKNIEYIKSRLDRSYTITSISNHFKVSEKYITDIIIPHSEILKKAKLDWDNRDKHSHSIQFLDYDFKNINREEWKPILGYDYYFVSDKGRIKLFNPENKKYGLITFCENKRNKELYVEMQNKRICVSRIVAHSFVEGWSKDRNKIIHLDKDVLNNSAENLKWISSHKDNINLNLKKKEFKKIILNDKYEFSSILSMSKFLNIPINELTRYIHGECKSPYKITFTY